MKEPTLRSVVLTHVLQLARAPWAAIWWLLLGEEQRAVLALWVPAHHAWRDLERYRRPPG